MIRILLSNDDGVHAPGLLALANELASVAEVTVLAPDRNRSGASNSLTLSTPISVKTLENGFVSVEGTPTDCVHLAITGYLSELPDMVISGINEGENLSDDVWYSGTVAAAMEGRFCGLPAIAVSLSGSACKHYQTAAKVAKQLMLHCLKDPLPPNTILNVNVPDIPFEQLQGLEITRLGTRHCAEPTICTKDPRGRPVYWVGPAGKAQDAGPGTDFHAVMNQRVSITPLQLDITHYKAFEQLEQWVGGMKEYKEQP